MLQLHKGLKYAILPMNYYGGDMYKKYTDGAIVAFAITAACMITFIICALLNLL